jgi:hemerythrin-like domain-containing protein
MLIRIGQRPDHAFDEPLGLLSDCHRRIEHFLHVLEVVAARSSGDALATAERKDLEAAVTYFAQAAPRHTADEEQSLFPRLRASNDPAALDALATVERLERDHEVADAHHAAVDGLVREWLAAGALPPARLSELRDRLAALRAIYEPHIAVEDRELFPAAGRLLSKDDVAAIGREMAERRSLRPNR